MKPTNLVFLFIIHIWSISSKKHYIIEVADNEDLAYSSRYEEVGEEEVSDKVGEEEVSDEVGEEELTDEVPKEEVWDEAAEEEVSDEAAEEEVSDEVPEEEASEEREGVTRAGSVGGEDYWYWRRRGGRRG